MAKSFIRVAVIAFLLSLVFCFVLFAETKRWSAHSRGSLQIIGDHEVSLNGLKASEDVEAGLSFGLDIFLHFHKYFRGGIGSETQFGRSQKHFGGEFQFTNIYGVVCLPIDLKAITLYAIGRIGYGFFFGDIVYKGSYGELTGGLYYAGGAGIEFLKFKFRDKDRFLFLESTYSVNHGSIADYYFGLFADVRYSRVDISFGIGG